MDVYEQIAEMLGLDQEPNKDPKKIEKPVEEEDQVEEENVETSTEVVDEEEEAEVDEEAGEDEEDEEEVEDSIDEDSEVEAQLSALRAQVKNLAQELKDSGQVIVPEFKVEELLSDELIEDAREDNDKFREMIQNVLKIGYSEALALLKAETEKEKKASKLYEQFYSANPDLKEYDEFISYVATKLAKTQKFKSVDSFLNTLAKEVRSSLGLGKSSSKKSSGKPALPKKSKARPEKKELSKIEQEILDLIS